MTRSDPSDHPSEVIVRPCGPADWEGVIALLLGVYAGEGFTSLHSARQMYTRDRLSAGGLMLVAHDSTDILGAVLVATPGGPLSQLAGDGEAEFRLLAVSQRSRGRGVGEQLVRACMDRSYAQPHAAERIVICTQPIMKAAQKLYERLGFLRAPERDFEVPSSDPGEQPQRRLVYVHELLSQRHV
jgi:ribosomal protein S18 acetylase RimI-like enzyme